MADDAQIQITAAIGQAQDALRNLTKVAKDSFGGMADATRPTVDANKAVEKSHDGLLAKAREFKAEQVQQGRIARFYAGELLSIVPAGDAVKNKLQEVIGIGVEGLAGGLSFGLAFEGAKFAIGAVVEYLHEAHKVEEEAKKTAAAWLDTLNKGVGKLSESVDELRKKFLGVTPAGEAQARVQLIRDEIQAEREAIATIEAKNRALRESASKTDSGVAFSAGPDVDKQRRVRRAVEKNDEEIASHLAAIAALDRRIAKEGEFAKFEIQNVDKDKKQKDDAAAAEQWAKDFGPGGVADQAAKDAAARQTAYWVKLDDDKLKADADAQAAWDKDFGPGGVADQAAKDAAARQTAYWLKVDADKLKAEAEALAEQDKLVEQARAEMQRDIEKQAHAWISLGNSISGAFAQGFTNAIFSAKTAEEALKGIFEGIAQAFEKMIEQMIAKLMASAILGFLGELIGGPVGAFVGKEAGNGLFGSGGLPSFDVGSWNVPRDMVAVVHAGEIITPAGPSEDIRAGRASLGAGGVHVYFQTTAMDGPSVDRWWREQEGRVVSTVSRAIARRKL